MTSEITVPKVEELENSYITTKENLQEDWDRLCIEGNALSGMKICNHYFHKHRLNVRVKSGLCFIEWISKNLDTPYVLRTVKYNLSRGCTPSRAWFYAFNIYSGSGSISMFRPSFAKMIVEKYSAKCVLDPCAGWGGRLLGTISVGDGVKYIGIDTNINLQDTYKTMICEIIPKEKHKDITLLWENSCETDFTKYKYDLVLTSPPYWTSRTPVETYEHMPEWKSMEDYYTLFLIPLIKNVWESLEYSGRICLNIPLKTADYLKSILGDWEEVIPLNMKTNSFSSRKSYKEFVYVWRKWLPPPTWNDGGYVEVRRSLIPNSGNGLFAKRNIPKGTIISEYQGERMSLKDFHSEYGRDYLFTYRAMRIGKIINGKHPPYLTLNPSHYANEHNPPNICLKNWKLIALRDIDEGEEMYLNYMSSHPHHLTSTAH